MTQAQPHNQHADNAVDPVTPAAIEGKIFALLAARQAGTTICPSDVARALLPDGGAWRALMPHVRQVAHGLALQQRLAVTRRGVSVDALSPGGPIRLGSPTKPGKPTKT